MPITKVGDVNLEYYVEGSGPPLLMIMGMGGQALSWGEPFLERLRPHFKIIRFSNRGTGLSDKPATPFTVPQMADDAAGLLTELGIERAHVLGISLGGMIAQELVLSHPQRVEGLVLGCTACGPGHSVPTSQETIAKFGGIVNLPVDERIKRFWMITIAPEFQETGARFLDEIIGHHLKQPTPLDTFARQMAAASSFDTYERLPQIKAPTLIVHGDRDLLIPPGNAEVLQQRIAGSQVRIIAGVAHMFFWEKPEEASGAIVEFLAKVPVGR